MNKAVIPRFITGIYLFVFMIFLSSPLFVHETQAQIDDTANINPTKDSVSTSSADPNNSVDNPITPTPPTPIDLSPTLFPEITPSSTISPTLIPDINTIDNWQNQLSPSAVIRQPLALLPLAKKHFQQFESIQAHLSNAQNKDIFVSLQRGDISVPADIIKTVDNQLLNISIKSPRTFQPGAYSLEVSDVNRLVGKQEFFWGVLAINPDKAIY